MSLNNCFFSLPGGQAQRELGSHHDHIPFNQRCVWREDWRCVWFDSQTWRPGLLRWSKYECPGTKSLREIYYIWECTFPWSRNSTAVLSSDHNIASSQDGTVFGERGEKGVPRTVIKIRWWKYFSLTWVCPEMCLRYMSCWLKLA